MGGRIDTILMWIKFGHDPISSLDFSFTGGVPLNQLIYMSGQLKKIIVVGGHESPPGSYKKRRPSKSAGNKKPRVIWKFSISLSGYY